MNEKMLREIIREELAALMANTLPEKMTPAEVAKFLDVTPGTLAVWRSTGHGPAYTKAGKIMYLVSDINAWVQSERVGR